MSNIILALYFGSKLAENIASDSAISNIFNYNTLIILLVVVFVVLIISIFVFLIIPRINKTPKKYYQRYLLVRKELEKIDELYAKRRLSFENYVYTQFHYAKEYEHLIEYLSQYPEYRVKLKTYKLNITKTKESIDLSILSEKERRNLDTTNYFITFLLPVAEYYRKDEIYQAILDEGYSKEISDGVVKGLEKHGINFNSKEMSENRKAVDLVDSLLDKKWRSEKTGVKEKITTPDKYYSSDSKKIESTDNVKEVSEVSQSNIFSNNVDSKGSLNTDTTINLSDLIKEKSDKLKLPNFLRDQALGKDPKDEKDTPLSINKILKSKNNSHSVSEINDIFKNIDKKLK